MSELHTLMTGISFGESPRWQPEDSGAALSGEPGCRAGGRPEGRLWFCDWGAEELIALDEQGNSEVIVEVPSFPFCIDWLPDGRLLINAARQQAVLTLAPDKTLVTYADLSTLSDYPPNNEIVVDGRGNAYVDGGGFDMMAGEPPAPGMIALITPDGTAQQVADGIEFGNGMAITPDDRTLIVAESYGRRLSAFDIAPDGTLQNRRVWADLGDGVPDGICIDADGAVWYADVPNKRCVRVREGGEVLGTIDVDRGCFACMLGGSDGRTLFIVAREWHGAENMGGGAGSGQILTAIAPTMHAGRP